MTNLLLEQPCVGVRGNVRTSSIARWKARGRLLIPYNWIFFDSSYDSDVNVISIYWSKSVFSKVGVTLSANFRWKGTLPIILCWCQKTRLITLSSGIKISAVCSFVSPQSTRVTDRETNRASVAALHGNESDRQSVLCVCLEFWKFKF